MTPDFDVYSNLVYASNGSIVDTVICMGKVMMENRVVPGEEEMLRKHFQNRKIVSQPMTLFLIQNSTRRQAPGRR